MIQQLCPQCKVRPCEPLRKKYRKTCWKCRDQRDPKKVSQKSRNWGQRLKLEVISYYGGRCACCGESDIRFLTIDHIHGGGCQHRKEVGPGGTRMYSWLRKNEFPVNIVQVLCYNCNMGRAINNGKCPHKDFMVIEP